MYTKTTRSENGIDDEGNRQLESELQSPVLYFLATTLLRPLILYPLHLSLPHSNPQPSILPPGLTQKAVSLDINISLPVHISHLEVETTEKDGGTNEEFSPRETIEVTTRELIALPGPDEM